MNPLVGYETGDAKLALADLRTLAFSAVKHARADPGAILDAVEEGIRVALGRAGGAEYPARHRWRPSPCWRPVYRPGGRRDEHGG
jgi:hypothetical protein